VAGEGVERWKGHGGKGRGKGRGCGGARNVVCPGPALALGGPGKSIVSAHLV